MHCVQEKAEGEPKEKKGKILLDDGGDDDDNEEGVDESLEEVKKQQKKNHNNFNIHVRKFCIEPKIILIYTHHFIPF